MKKLVFIVLSLVLISALILSGCTKESTTTTKTTSPSSTPAGKTEILLGAINCMTGVEAMVGGEQKWAYEQAVKDINAKGGVFVKDLNKKLPMRIIFVDDESDVAKAAAGVEKLIKLEKVDVIL